MDRRRFLELTLGISALKVSALELKPQPLLRLVYYESAAPVSWRDEAGRMQGILVDLLDEALHQRLSLTLSHSGYPWARAQFMVQQGLADAFCTIPTPERMAYAVASTEPVLDVPLVMFAKRDSPRLAELSKVKGAADLRPFSIVSYIGSGWVKKNLATMNVHYVPTIEECLKLLAKGEADVYIDNRASTDKALKELSLQNEIVEVPPVMENTRYHLCLRKGSPLVSILPAFDKAIAQMREDGSHARILAKYGYR